MDAWPLFRSSITPTPESASNGSKPTLTLCAHSDISHSVVDDYGDYTRRQFAQWDTHTVYDLAATLKHLAHLGRQVPCALTLAGLPRRSGTLTASNVGVIGGGESAMPMLVLCGGSAIIALGRACDGCGISSREMRKVSGGFRWALAGRRVTGR